MEGYKVVVRESSKELTAKERIRIKDTTNAIKLDEVVDYKDGTRLRIDVDYYAVLDVHNENSENKDYCVYVIADKNGTTYVTGSEAFFTSFTDIYDEMSDDESGEEWAIEVYKKPSKNYNGEFITCSIL